jgi:lysophospholipid acyltransferase (LPLAT)-like uncharacterized protein
MSDVKKSVSLKNQVSGIGLHWLSVIVGKTCKAHIVNLKYLKAALNSEKPVIFTGWHGITMLAVPLIQKYFPKMDNLLVLMPDDWRGDALKIWAEKMGAIPHPMNLTGDQTMGMARMVVRLTRRVMEGKSLYINPDGPDGPAQVIKPGIIYIAKKTNAVIVPIGAYCRAAYVVPRWDRYAVPFPFSRITYHIGEPIFDLPDDSDEATKGLTAILNGVSLQAAADYYELKG